MQDGPHDRLITERSNPASARLDELSTLEMVRVMNREDASVAPAVARELEAIARAIDAIAERMQRGGRLVHVGAGTSGRLGVLDAAECPPTFGVAPDRVIGLIAGGEAALVRAVEGAEDRSELAVQDLTRIGLGSGDSLVAISASGRTPYALAAVEHARKVGALTVGLSCNPGSVLSKAVELAITPVPGPEVVTGSTRLKAGTATKLVLNLLSTGVMVRLGHVRGNRMVDLAATNDKLRERATGLVRDLAGVDEAAARSLLRQHGSIRAAAAAATSTAATADAKGTGAAAAIVTNGCVVGIDGGGTRTRATLGETAGGDPKADAESGPCNLTSDLPLALRSIEEALARLRADAGTRERPFDAICIAAAGSGDATIRERARAELLSRGIARRVALVPDAAAVLAAANDDAFGLALIAGTGSLAFARTRDGRCARAGGYGPAIGDPGSGHALGASALRAAVLVADGHPGSTRLMNDVLNAAGVANGRALAQVARDWRPDAVAALAPLVARAALDGDPSALRMLNGAASQLAELASLVLRRLFPDDGKGEASLPLVLAGGLFTGIPAIAQLVGEALAKNGARLEITKVKRTELGALALARRLAAGALDEASWFPT